MVQLEIRNTISSELISISVLYNEPIQQLRVTVCARFGGLLPADLVLISNGVKYENKRKLSDYVKGHHTEPISVFAISVPGEGNVMSEPTQPAVDNSPKTLSVFRDYSRLSAPRTATVVPVTHRVTSLDIEQDSQREKVQCNGLTRKKKQRCKTLCSAVDGYCTDHLDQKPAIEEKVHESICLTYI